MEKTSKINSSYLRSQMDEWSDILDEKVRTKKSEMMGNMGSVLYHFNMPPFEKYTIPSVFSNQQQTVPENENDKVSLVQESAINSVKRYVNRGRYHTTEVPELSIFLSQQDVSVSTGSKYFSVKEGAVNNIREHVNQNSDLTSKVAASSVLASQKDKDAGWENNVKKYSVPLYTANKTSEHIHLNDSYTSEITESSKTEALKDVKIKQGVKHFSSVQERTVNDVSDVSQSCVYRTESFVSFVPLLQKGKDASAENNVKNYSVPLYTANKTSEHIHLNDSHTSGITESSKTEALKDVEMKQGVKHLSSVQERTVNDISDVSRSCVYRAESFVSFIPLSPKYKETEKNREIKQIPVQERIISNAGDHVNQSHHGSLKIISSSAPSSQKSTQTTGNILQNSSLTKVHQQSYASVVYNQVQKEGHVEYLQSRVNSVLDVPFFSSLMNTEHTPPEHLKLSSSLESLPKKINLKKESTHQENDIEIHFPIHFSKNEYFTTTRLQIMKNKLTYFDKDGKFKLFSMNQFPSAVSENLSGRIVEYRFTSWGDSFSVRVFDNNGTFLLKPSDSFVTTMLERYISDFSDAEIEGKYDNPDKEEREHSQGEEQEC